MSEAIKPTPGEWRTNGDEVCSDAVGCIAICGMAATFRGWSGSDFSTEKFQRSNARLIAEAGNVFNETQCTPRQLVERVKELEEALRNFADLYDTDEGCRSLPQYVAARAALSKSLPNTVAEVK